MTARAVQVAADAPGTRPRAVLFDWDNTLITNFGAIHRALQATFAAMGHEPWTFEETLQRVRKSLRDSFPDLFGDRWQEARAIFYDAFASAHIDTLRPLEGAAEMLAELRALDIYAGVVSNKTGTYLRREVAHLGWDRLFGRLVGADDAARDKPDPAPVEMALSGSGVVCGPDVWFVGDTDIDLECAHNAGCVPVLLRDAPPAPGEFDAHPPAWYVRDCRQLAALVRGL